MSETDGITTGTVLAGRYRTDQRIGRGGFGAVWQAEDRVLGRAVAVKVLAEPFTEDAGIRERFRREALAAAKLTHTHIASVFDYGEHDGIPFIVMELLAGETLTQRLRRGQALPPAAAAEIGAQVAEALAGAHAAGVVHRDVKPDNVLLPDSGGVKVLDFGLAATTWAPALTHPDLLIGTPRYMAPERAAGDTGDAAADVYSLGVVLYEMLAGRPPFTGDSLLALVTAHATLAPDPLAGAGVPRGLARLVEESLSKDPSARPGAAALAARLRAAATGRADSTVLRRVLTLPLAAAREARGSGGSRAAAATTVRLDRDAGPDTPDTPAAAAGPGTDRRGQAVAVGAAVALVALVLAVGWPRGQPEAAPPATTAPPVTTATTIPPPPVGASPVAEALGEVVAAVESGLAGGEVRDDVAVDLGNLLGNLERRVGDGRRDDLIREVDDLALKVQVRVREGAISPQRAAEIQARLQLLRAAL